MENNMLLKISLIISFVLIMSIASADVPKLINIQGKTDANKNPLTGSYNLTVTIFNAASGGTNLYWENLLMAKGRRRVTMFVQQGR